jgi:hypothetical protein
MGVELQQYHSSHRCLFSSYENLVVAFWDRDVPLATIDELGALLRSVRSRYPAFGVLVWVAPSTLGIQSREEQAAISRTMRANADGFRGLAYVHVGDGFVAATIRASIAGINLLARPKHQVKVFAKTEPALRWLGDLCAPKVDVDALDAAVDSAFRSWDQERRAR